MEWSPFSYLITGHDFYETGLLYRDFLLQKIDLSYMFRRRHLLRLFILLGNI